MTIEANYRRLHAGSAARYQQARTMFPNGVTHDGRYVTPFPLYVERSQGAYKWDADGNRLIDYVTGHGALLLGHAHPAVVAAVSNQMARGTHYGAESELAIQWAALIQELFPSIERLRFTASGTEATMLALRLARAYTGRPVVVRLAGHYHGWHDLLARDSAADSSPPGVYDGLLEATMVLPADLACIEATLAARSDIAAVILEPTGASYGALPLPQGFLRELRALTAARDVLLICDEVAVGFGRTGKMFACEHEGVEPDLMCVAKGITGGYLPLAATFATERIFDAFLGRPWEGKTFYHGHTYTGNPLACAAALASLDLFDRNDVLRNVGGNAEAFGEFVARRELHQRPFVGDIRYKGTMIGVELVEDQKTRARFDARRRVGAEFCARLRKRGVILRSLGDVIVIMPPLAIGRADFLQLCDAVVAELAQMESSI